MKVLTSKDISKKYAGNLPNHQHKANAAWIENTRNMLNDDGVWFYPNANKTFQKVDGGWKELS